MAEAQEEPGSSGPSPGQPSARSAGRRGQDRFGALFTGCPVALWEADIAELLACIDRHRAEGPADLRAHLEAHPEKMTRCAAMIRVVSVNQAALDLHEAPDEERLLGNLATVLTEGSPATFREIVIALAEGKRQFESEADTRTLRGKRLHVGLKWSLLPDHEGRLTRVLLSVVDLTARRSDEVALRRSEESLRKAQRFARMGNWEWNILTDELTWSEEVYRLYGFDPRSGPPSFDLVVKTLAPECRDRFVAAVEDAVKLGTPFDGEYRIISLDGTVRHTHTAGEVTRDGEGRPVSMFGIVQDVTERKLAEEAEHASRQTLEAVIETAPT